MSEFRCPKHDSIFETMTDHRKPGALAAANFPAHPKDGHPDCPKCIEEKEESGKERQNGTSEVVDVKPRASNRPSNRKVAA